MIQNVLLVLQFYLFALASAAPVDATALDNTWQYGTGGGILGFIVLILDIIVFSTYPMLYLPLIQSRAVQCCFAGIKARLFLLLMLSLSQSRS